MAQTRDKTVTAGTRLIVITVVGLAVGALVGSSGARLYAPLAGWIAAALLFVAWTLLTVLRFSATETRAHALRENPVRPLADALLLSASLASLVAVGFLVFHASHSSGADKALDIGLGFLGVVVSWAAVHTTYMLKYARLYYGEPEGGIDFNQATGPRYMDFAYLAFTVGMTYQVSDTAVSTKEIRGTILKQALLSFVFGTVIIATTINALASLSQ